MTPRKLKIYIGMPTYSSNGGIASIHPDCAKWLVETVLKIKADPRCDPEICLEMFCDTPVTLTRNRFAKNARAEGCDLLVMLDSDQAPQLWKQDPQLKPFWDTSFDFLYKHYEKGPVVIGAPYCGPPPNSNCYVFRWAALNDAGADGSFKLEQYGREEAAMMGGIQECAALPTGLIMYDMRCFDLIEHPYFAYEYTDETESEKGSTEDVMNTRNVSMCGQKLLGYNPVFVNWDAWIGHWKPWCVGKPRVIHTDQVNKVYTAAVKREMDYGDQWINVQPSSRLERMLAQHDIALERRNGHASKNGKEVKFEAPPLVTRLVYGHKVVTWPNGTPDEHLRVLHELAHDCRFRDTKERPMYVVEVGSWAGESTVAIATALGPRDDLDCVDTWEGSPNDWTGELAKHHDMLDLWRKNVAPFACVNECEGRSPEAAEDFDDGSCDMIFIDADHSYEAVKADIEAWLPKVKPGGVLCGHDYGTIQFPGVTQAVKEKFGSTFQIAGVCEQGAIWVYHKPLPLHRSPDWPASSEPTWPGSPQIVHNTDASNLDPCLLTGEGE